MDENSTSGLTEKQEFKKWGKNKCVLHRDKNLPKFQEKEVWWCCCGKNVGNEMDGKHRFFVRPCLIFKKLSDDSFMGIPMTSQDHRGSWYVRFRHGEYQSLAVLNQARVMSAFRLKEKYTDVKPEEFERIRKAFFELYKPLEERF